MALALFFGKKKDETPQPTPANSSAQPASPGSAPAPSPAGAAAMLEFDENKAGKFFQHARTVQETGNHEYAMQLWLQGMKFNPKSMEALQAFFNCTAQYLSEPASKKGPGKELVKSVSGNVPVEKYAKALLEWGLKPDEAQLAAKAMELAATMGLDGPGIWIGERAFGFALREKKVRKELLLKIADSFNKLNAPERALGAAEAASKLDPSDGELQAYIRNLAATATMTRSGFDKLGQEGGFRNIVRDSTKQRQLEEGERLVKSSDTIERVLQDAELEFTKRPNDLPTIENLARRLLERGQPKDEERAHKVYMDAFATTNQFRFRELAGDIRLRQSLRKLRELEKMLATAQAAKSPDTEMVQGMFEQLTLEHTKLELQEFKLRVENYPTDLARKFELGKRHLLLGEHDDAIGLFQESQQDTKLRVASLNYLGQCFLKIRYFDEAVHTFQNSLDGGEMTPESNIEIKYNLMLALVEQGTNAKNVTSLREADKLASAIAMKQFNYREIRAKREEIKKLIAEAGGGS
jgi:tetratricopeptide (TPR) repeat protein